MTHPVSKDNVKNMFGVMITSDELQKKYVEMLRRNQNAPEDIMAEKLIEFGRTSGFAFSKKDLMAARAEIMDRSNDNRELSDNELSNIAGGGKSGVIITSISTLGFGCAITSMMYESSKGGECGRVMSTTQKC